MKRIVKVTLGCRGTVISKEYLEIIGENNSLYAYTDASGQGRFLRKSKVMKPGSPLLLDRSGPHPIYYVLEEININPLLEKAKTVRDNYKVKIDRYTQIVAELDKVINEAENLLKNTKE